jgi:hypothetical protein
MRSTEHKQAGTQDSEAIAALDRAQQARQSPIDQLREYMLRPQRENESRCEKDVLWRERFPWLFSYQTAFVVATCSIGILIALGIVWLDNPRAFVDGSRADIASTAPPIPTVMHLTTSAPPTTTQRPQITARPALAPVPTNTTKHQASPAAASPQPLPSAMPIPTTTPTVTAVVPVSDSASAGDLLLRAAQAETTLRTGQLEATITFGSGQRSSAQMGFDLGDEQRVPSCSITTTYEGATGAQTTERITIGDQSWERQQASQWTVMPARETVLKQLQVFLPRTDSISKLSTVTVKRAAVEDTYALHWYDAARNADVTLVVDAAAIPQQLRRVSRANGLILTVSYSGWNTAVEITPPDRH